MVKIIGISGRKQSGKNTVANYINGDILKNRDMIKDFFINENGELAIETTDHNGKLGYGVLDITRKDKTFIEYAERELWPFVKVYSFADPLKEICINLFGFTYQQVYGNDSQKNTKINIQWQNVPFNTEKKRGDMTARDFLQHFGTNVIRRMRDEAWVDCTMKKILREDSEIAIIADVRFPNEIKAIKEHGGIMIRMTRDIFNSDHKCEQSLDKDKFDWSNFDYVIENKDYSIEDLCNNLKKIREIWC